MNKRLTQWPLINTFQTKITATIIFFLATYGTVCIQLTYLSKAVCGNMCNLSCYHHQTNVWHICHCLGLGHETMACALSLLYSYGTHRHLVGRYCCQSKVKIWSISYNHIALGAVSIRKTVLPGMAIPMLKIRRPNGRLIFNMEIAIRR